MKRYLVLMGATMAVLFAPRLQHPACRHIHRRRSHDHDSHKPLLPSRNQMHAGGIPTMERDIDCLDLASSGGDAAGELARLGTEPFTLATVVRDGALSFSSRTPCKTLMSSAEVTDKRFIVDPNMAMALMACQSSQSDDETWVATFLSTPLDYTLNKDSLVPGRDNGTVAFKPAAT